VLCVLRNTFAKSLERHAGLVKGTSPSPVACTD
jgi:hypothetical protein